MSSPSDPTRFSGRGLVDGGVRAAISNALVQLHSRHFGKGPTRCRTYAIGDLVVTVMEDVFTTVEKTLIGTGKASTVREVRLSFQDAMASRFIVAVEELTGRQVQAFFPSVSVDANMAVELFVLEPLEPEPEPA